MISVFGSKTGKEEISQIADSIDKSWLGMGKKVSEFELRFKERLNLLNFLLVDSGSNALYMAVRLLELPEGSEIILPSFTWVSCAHAIILAGHKPVFCDVELTTQNITAEHILPHLTSKTAAIMIVHYAGKPVDMDSVKELGLPIIEDAAHAVDSFYKGKPCGGIGDVGIYSFDAVKNLTTGEGGGITCNTDEKINLAKKLRYCGIGKSGFQASQSSVEKSNWWEYDISEVFIKMLPSDISAGIGLAQLDKIDAHQRHRANIWQSYQKAFKDVAWITTPVNAEGDEQHSYFTYFIQVPHRTSLAKYLYEKGIYTTLRYHPLHLNPIYKSEVKLPNSERLNEVGLNIPIHPNISSDDVEFIVNSIIEFKP